MVRLLHETAVLFFLADHKFLQNMSPVLIKRHVPKKKRYAGYPPKVERQPFLSLKEKREAKPRFSRVKDPLPQAISELIHRIKENHKSYVLMKLPPLFFFETAHNGEIGDLMGR